MRMCPWCSGELARDAYLVFVPSLGRVFDSAECALLALEAERDVRRNRIARLRPALRPA